MGEMAQGPRKLNYFLAIQITDKEIKQNIRTIQETIKARDGSLSSRMESIETLHLTLGLYYFDDARSVSKCKAALDRFQTRLRSENFVPPRLTVSKLGHFDDKVLFAALDDNEGLEDLKILTDNVRRSLSRDGIRTTDDRFSPHVTICKIPKRNSQTIDPSCYDGMQSTYFGRQTIESIQLCSMQKPKTESGYYHIDHEIRFY